MACRLYGQALETQTKLAQARKARDAEASLNAQVSGHRMTWVSQELTKGRTTGEYSNYGERLYVEGMLEHEKKKAAVQLCWILKQPCLGMRPCCCLSCPLQAKLVPSCVTQAHTHGSYCKEKSVSLPGYIPSRKFDHRLASVADRFGLNMLVSVSIWKGAALSMHICLRQEKSMSATKTYQKVWI